MGNNVTGQQNPRLHPPPMNPTEGQLVVLHRIVFLNNILPFVTNDLREALELRLICTDWADALEHYCAELWDRCYGLRLLLTDKTRGPKLLTQICSTGRGEWLLRRCLLSASCYGVDIDAALPNLVGNWSLVTLAASCNQAHITRMLLERGALPRDALFHACANNCQPVIEVLLKDGEDHAGAFAPGGERYAAVKKQLDQSVQRSRWRDQEVLSNARKWIGDYSYRAPIEQWGAVEGVPESKMGDPINILNEARSSVTGDSVLHILCERNHVELLKLVLPLMRNLSPRNKKQSTPLHVAVARGNLVPLQMLLDTRKVKQAEQEGQKQEQQQSQQTQHPAASTLELNARDAQGQTPLHIGCSRGRAAAVKMLLDYRDESRALFGIDIDANDAQFCSAVQAAASCEDEVTEALPIVKMLLERGVRLNSSSRSGFTVLAAAVFAGNASVVEMLLSNEALDKEAAKKWSCISSSWRSLTEMARDRGHNEISALLEKYLA